MLDKYHRYKATEETGIELLYRDSSIRSVEFDDTADTRLYNSLCDSIDIEKLQILSEQDFDRINTYIIPQHYNEIDVEKYVTSLVSNTEDQTDNLAYLNRVEEELALYKARNLYPVLQVLIYIIDTMRKNNLVWGVGRGSSVASYVLYLIGVHKIDSIKYNLDIKEFLKEE